jgi:ubiquinone/menaquinone biosynthesis C-methylase UbiE
MHPHLPLRRKVPTTMNLSSFFSDQARKPSGWFGSIVMPIVFDQGNAFLNRLVHTLMEVHPDDRVLEIGCGTGKLAKMMAKTIENGIIEGIDFSSPMVKIARRKNNRGITRGIVNIVEDNFDETTSINIPFTKVCCVNTVYFWKNPQNTINKVFDILEPGGKFIVAFEDIGQLRQRKISTDVFRLYRANDVERLLKKGGFTNVHIE